MKPDLQWLVPHCLLQSQLYEAYAVGSSPLRTDIPHINELHMRAKKLTDWLTVELLLLADPANQSLQEIAKKFRAEEEALDAQEGEAASQASSTPLTQ